MKTIAITGGKGGTGKSTLAVLTARKLAKNNKVVLCDCDVECPNDYLILGRKLGQPKARSYAEFPKLNKKKCIKCGLCVKVCKNNAIFQKPGEYPVFIKELCSGCGACQAVWPAAKKVALRSPRWCNQRSTALLHWGRTCICIAALGPGPRGPSHCCGNRQANWRQGRAWAGAAKFSAGLRPREGALELSS